MDPGKDLPDAFSGVGTPTAAQEKNFAEPGTGVAASSVAPFSTFFSADQADKYGLSVWDSATAADNAALRRAGYSLSFQYVDANGDPVPGAENRAAKSIAAGEPVDEAAPTVTPPSYRLPVLTRMRPLSMPGVGVPPFASKVMVLLSLT